MLIDLLGRTFGDLTVTGRAESDKKGEVRWHCRCSCGGVSTSSSSNLRRGHTTSCGCAVARFNRKVRTTHGGTGSPEYQIWQSMLKRCYNPKSQAFDRYGGRGIGVYLEWRSSFAAFLRDVGPRPDPSLSLDRIDNDGDYKPGNVRWATATEQAANRRGQRISDRCRNGHPRTPETLHISPNGERRCRVCGRDQAARKRRRIVVAPEDRTGQLTTLLPPLSAAERGSQVVHAAEERVVPVPGGGSLRYPELTALCGEDGWGAAERPLGDTTCGRCRRTKRFREVVAAAGPVGAEPADSPHDGDEGYGGGR